VGLKESPAMLVLRQGTSPKSILYLKDRHKEEERWNGESLGLRRARKKFKVDDIRDISEFENDLPSLLHGSKTLYYPLGSSTQFDHLIVKALSNSFGPRFLYPNELKDSRLITSELRLIKDKDEISSLKRASEITAKALKELAPYLSSFKSEMHCATELEALFIKYGAHGLLAVAPYYNKPTQEGLFQHFSHLGRMGKVPIIVYNVPGRTVVSISVPTLERLSREPNIVALKEASDSVDRLTEIGALLGDKLSILSGDDGSLAYMLLCKGSGAISAPASAMPDELLKIYNLASSKDWEGAFNAQAEAIYKIRALFLEPNPCPAKTVLKIKGIIKSDIVRLPLVATSEEIRAVLVDTFRL